MTDLWAGIILGAIGVIVIELAGVLGLLAVAAKAPIEKWWHDRHDISTPAAEPDPEPTVPYPEPSPAPRPEPPRRAPGRAQ